MRGKSVALIGSGWLPAGIGGRYSTVRWIQLGDRALSEPFFRQTVDVLRRSTPRANEFESGTGLLCESVRSLPPVQPAGVIFHVSRCGSTLLLNGLKASSHAVGVGESPALDEAMRLARSPIDHWAAVGKELCNSLVSLFANYLPGGPRRVLIKCGIGSLWSVKSMRSIWPNVPFVILVRDPVEVVVSNLQRPPRWLIDGFRDPRCLGWGSPPPSDCTQDYPRFASWMIGHAFAEAVGAADNGGVVIDYAQLSPSLVAKIGAICGLEFSDSDYTRCSQQFLVHAHTQSQVFESDRAIKQKAASQEILNSVAEWITPAFGQLSRASRASLTASAG